MIRDSTQFKAMHNYKIPIKSANMCANNLCKYPANICRMQMYGLSGPKLASNHDQINSNKMCFIGFIRTYANYCDTICRQKNAHTRAHKHTHAHTSAHTHTSTRLKISLHDATRFGLPRWHQISCIQNMVRKNANGRRKP